MPEVGIERGLVLPEHKNCEVVERKGAGHPDTLADSLAEELSITYSQYTRRRFGAILHHNFDKVALLGGSAEVTFGHGRMISPVRVLLNGRASGTFGGADIAVRDLLTSTVHQFFSDRFPMLAERDIRILYEVSTAASPGRIEGKTPGKRHFWFNPRSLDDLSEIRRLFGNDSSVGCGWAPLSPLESLALGLECTLNAPQHKLSRPWLGSDIKVLACRSGQTVDLTICIPQLADHCRGLDEFVDNLDNTRQFILDYAHHHQPSLSVRPHLNTGDDPAGLDIYLTVTGSCIESGDEGIVGRGNRMGGLISPDRPITMEGISGKNPVYHAGKMYCVTAQIMAAKLWEDLGVPAEVIIAGQRGRLLADPAATIIRIPNSDVADARIRDLASEVLAGIPTYTDRILAREFRLS